MDYIERCGEIDKSRLKEHLLDFIQLRKKLKANTYVELRINDKPFGRQQAPIYDVDDSGVYHISYWLVSEAIDKERGYFGNIVAIARKIC